MTDADFLYDILKDHQWHSTSEILRYSIEERGHGLTVHSRVAQLRGERNLNIVHRVVNGHRADAHQYRLMALSEPERTAVAWSGDSSGSLSGEESKPANRPTGMSSRAKDAETPASRPQDGADPFSGAHPAPTAAQLISDPRESNNAGPASPSSPEGCPQDESAQQLSFEVAA